MQFFQQFAAVLESLALEIPLELFSFIASFIEEVVAPIPSPLVMFTAGTIAAAQNQLPAYLIIIALIGAIGKTLGALVLYFLADKAEDIVIGKFGKFLGVSHKEIEGIGRYFNRSFKDYIILFVLRALPIMPSSPVSVVCGVIKINLRTYLTSSFAGIFVRNLIFLYLGFSGIVAYNTILEGVSSIESIIEILLVLILVGIIGGLYYFRKKGKSLKLLGKFTNNSKDNN